MYNNVENLNCDIKIDNSYLKVSRKKQTLFSWLLIYFVLFNGVSFFNFNQTSNSIKRIVASWAPNENIGKIKFVSSDSEEVQNVMSFFEIDYCLPLDDATLSKGENGEIIVSSNSDILVKACYKSKVIETGNVDGKRSITFDCGFNVKVVYLGLDNVGVKVGNCVNKGDGVGVANSNIIKIKILYKNKIYDKLKIKNNKISLF